MAAIHQMKEFKNAAASCLEGLAIIHAPKCLIQQLRRVFFYFIFFFFLKRLQNSARFPKVLVSFPEI